MPGGVLVTDGDFASGTVTLSAAPADGDTVGVFGTTFTFRTTPSAQHDVLIGADEVASAENLADTVNGAVIPISAEVTADGEVTITANSRGSEWNLTVSSSGVAITTADMTGGVDVTKARVDVPTGVNISLSSIAKKLVLRPIGTSGEDDFIIYKAAAPGALNFTYNVDQERIYTANFKGYVDPQSGGALFAVGDEDATA
jgi:hypothetical protein